MEATGGSADVEQKPTETEKDTAREITDKIFEKFDADGNREIDTEECKTIFLDVLKTMHATSLKVSDD